MEQNCYPSNYYNDITVQKLSYDHSDVLKFVEIVKTDIMESRKLSTAKMYKWYENWIKNDIEYTLLAYCNKTPISFASYKSDGKVLCYLYTLKDYRNIYRELAQIDYLPIHVHYTSLNKLYLSIDAFDKAHERLAKAWDRKLISGIPEHLTPYRGKFKYCGVNVVRGVNQHIYELEIT